MQFGLYGFDLVRHHVTLLGPDLLSTFRASVGSDLEFLAKDRLRALMTSGTGSFNDPPSKKAIEAIKAAAILLALQRQEQPTRDKRRALSIFLNGTAGTDVPREVALEAWAAYRHGVSPPSRASLESFVAAVGAAFS
jgi:hypothetical protein